MFEKSKLSNYFQEKNEEKENITFPLFIALAATVFVGCLGYGFYLDYYFNKGCHVASLQFAIDNSQFAISTPCVNAGA